MPQQDNLLFQAISLLSQHLASLKPDGELYQKTSCLGAEERETIAILEYIKFRKPERKQKIDLIIPFFEKIGVAHWQRSELTDLGLRVGKRHRVDVKLAPDEVDLSGSTDRTEVSQ